MKEVLTKAEALSQYSMLLESNKDNNSLLDKASGLRSRIDTILRMAYVNMFPEKANKIANATTRMMADKLLADSRHSDLRKRLHMARKTLNKKAMHRYMLETHNGTEFNEKEYRACLSAICDFIAVMSSQPIPPALRQFIKNIKYKKVRKDARLDIIFLVELYSNLDQLNDGALMLKEFKRMIKEKNKLGLKRLNIHLITYTPGTQVFSPLRANDDTRQFDNGIGTTQQALGLTLLLLNTAIEEWKKIGGNKPWLVWIASELTNKPDESQTLSIQQWMDRNEMAFYPMATNRSAVDEFARLWPCCGPESLNPRLCGNFFKSMLDTIQKLFDLETTSGHTAAHNL